MTCESLALQSVTPHFGQDQLDNILEANLKFYYDWALLCIGGWTEVVNPVSGAYGGDFSQLRVIDTKNYDLGQVWEAPRKDWIWEQEVEYIDTQGNTSNPLVVGDPVVNNVAVTGGYHINYPEGQIIFDTARSSSDTVTIDYSYRNVQIYRADDAPWWRQLQFSSYRPDSDEIAQLTDGNWSLFAQHRVQMPTVVIESVARGISRGCELGSSTKEASRDILFHIFAENRHDRNNLMDIISLQTDRQIPLFNTNQMAELEAFPLDFQGSIVNNNHYANLVNGPYRWRNCLMQNSTISNIAQIHPNLYSANVRTTMSIIV